MKQLTSPRVSVSTGLVLVLGLALYVIGAGAFAEYSANVAQGGKYVEAVVWASVPVVGAAWVVLTFVRGRRAGGRTPELAAQVGRTLLWVGVAVFGFAGLLAGLSVP